MRNMIWLFGCLRPESHPATGPVCSASVAAAPPASPLQSRRGMP